MAAASAAQPDPGTGGRTTPGWWAGTGRVDSGGDIDRVLTAANAAGRDRTAAFARTVERAAHVTPVPDAARFWPVAPELAGLLPWPGLRRGATIGALGSTSLLFALLAAAMAAGAWAAVAGLPNLGLLAAAEYGINLGRLALVPQPGDRWPTVVGALIDGLDIGVVAPPGAVPTGTARTLAARARQRGCVLVPVGEWPGCDVTLRLLDRRWHGLGLGRGRLREQEVTLTAVGRGRAALPRQVSTTLPPPSVTSRVARLPGDSGPAGRAPAELPAADPAPPGVRVNPGSMNSADGCVRAS